MVEQDVIAKLRSLSKREKDILLLVCDGRSYEEIAEEFFISINTVKSHVGHIYIKLGLDGLPRSLRRTILSKEY
jgi:DNA-binding CsgD family transcriptional regulator